MEGLRIQIQTRRCLSASPMGGSIPTEAGLANVVCCAVKLPEQSLVSTTDVTPARGATRGDGSVGRQPISRSSSSFCPGRYLRLPFHGSLGAPRDTSHLDPHKCW